VISRYVLSGSGGQGVITAAIVLAEAAVFHEGLEAVQTQSYGPEARGGSARADVIIATSPIFFPKVLEPNVLVCLSQLAYDKYAWIVRPGGIIVLDTHSVTARQNVNSRQVGLELHRSTVGRFGSPLGINICVLGALAGLTEHVRLESLEKAVLSRFDERYRERNLASLRLGHELVKESVELY
jgi:2-oxoglutarate ferredoxin oxidoreductase subunit gamma